MIDNIERRARLACFVLELFPNIMQLSVSHYMLKTGLSNKYCNNIRYPSVFTTTELLLIQELPNVNNFTIQLCYKLITFEELLPTPSKGWGKFPDSNALKVEDDIERIRHGINEILTVNDDHFTECYLVKFLYKLEPIIQRLQIALGTTRVDSIYKSVLRKDIDTAVVLAELRNVDIIDSDVTLIKLQDRERYSKIGAVVTEFFPKILRINIPTWFSPLIVYNMCTNSWRYWNKSQKLQINTLQSSLNFKSLDASMLYQLFRKYSFVPDPTQGWGNVPTESDKCTADDIERIHHLRNECAHRCDTCIDQATFDNYFVLFHKITHRIASDYEHELSATYRDSLDPKRQKELEEALQKLEDIKEQFQRKPMKFFWGNDMALLIKDIRQRVNREKDILGQEKFLIEIELMNIDDAETKAKILNEARSQINEIDLNIEFLGAFTGSLVLYAYISRETLATDEILQTELSSFMTRILKKGKFGIISTQWIDAVIFPSEGNKELELNSSTAKSLKLQFMVKKNVFETDVSLESEIGTCMQQIMKPLVGKGLNEEVTAIVHYVESDDTERTHAMEPSQPIPVDTIVEIKKEETVVSAVIEQANWPPDDGDSYQDTAIHPCRTITCITETEECIEANIKTKDEDHIPKNIRAHHGQEIREWEQDQTTFLETRATSYILGSLPLHNCIVVTGSSGCGKSSNIHHAALHLREKFEYEIIPVLTGPTDIINYYNENRRQVFVVDDICGKETITTQTFQIWRDQSEQMDKIFRIAEKDVSNTNDGIVSKVSSPKLLISCRLHIYKDSQFQRVSFLTEKECNLLSPELCLLPKERMCMLRKYLPDDTIAKLNETQFIENVDFFPLVCKIAKGKKLEDVHKLFEAPLNSIKLTMQNIIDANKDQLCALVLCILFDDGFNTEWLILRAAPEEKKYKIKEIVDEFEINLDKQRQRSSLKSGFSTLDGTFLKLRGTDYTIIHDKIYKLAAVICGNKLTECFIKYAPSIFIRDRFIFESLAGVLGNDYSIVLLTPQEEDYFERLLCDLKDANITSTFNNNQLIYQSFRNRLISFFRKSEDGKSVLKNLDTKKCILEKNLPFSFKTTPLIESALRGYHDIVQFMLGDIKCNVNNTDSQCRSPLHNASQRGHSDVVKLLLENKADISQCDIWGKSPLYVACEGGYTEIVELFLQYNADVSQCDNEKRSPLHASCKGGHTDIVKLLLKKNADLFQCDNFETSPFYMACKGGYTDTVDFLLQYNDDVFRCDTHHKCPLHVTCEEGHVDILNLLLQNDAHISQCSQPPLHFACKGGHIDIVKLLLQHNADVLQCDHFGNSPLYVSCEKGHIEIVQLLLQNNADVTVHEDDDDSSLYVSCERGYINIVKLLLQNNADVSQWGLLEKSPLQAACANGHADIVELLLQYNADVSMCSYDSNSPLLMAVIKGHTATVKLLLEKNADPSACNNDGESPLVVACDINCIDIVKLLLQHNADPSLCNNNGESPLYMACKNKSIEVVTLLLKYRADINRCNIDGESALCVACEDNCIDIIKLLLQYNPDVNQCNIEGKSPLYMACKNKSIEIVKLLLENNADLSRCNNNGKSPLYVACKKDSKEIVKLLLENNADVSQYTNDQVSPLCVACQHENIDIVKLLLQYNADVSHCNNDGESPLYIACEGGSTDLVNLLLANKADISQCNTNSQSSLYVACKESHEEIVNILLKNEADISQCEKIDGRSPLHVACDIDSSYAFQFVHKDSRIKIVELLLTWNADVSLCDKNGQTPLDIARKSQCKEIVNLLEKKLQC